jgi:hypothetical protein
LSKEGKSAKNEHLVVLGCDWSWRKVSSCSSWRSNK